MAANAMGVRPIGRKPRDRIAVRTMHCRGVQGVPPRLLTAPGIVAAAHGAFFLHPVFIRVRDVRPRESNRQDIADARQHRGVQRNGRGRGLGRDGRGGLCGRRLFRRDGFRRGRLGRCRLLRLDGLCRSRSVSRGRWVGGRGRWVGSRGLRRVGGRGLRQVSGRGRRWWVGGRRFGRRWVTIETRRAQQVITGIPGKRGRGRHRRVGRVVAYLHGDLKDGVPVPVAGL